MACMVPESCPPRATTGEKRLYALLRDALPDHFTAWYEPQVAGRHPDFTLLADDFGLLVLEVKGWYAGQIAQANDDEVELHRVEGGETKVEVHANPNRQAREYVLAVIDQLGRPEFAILQHPDGAHRGRPCFPYGCGVVFTNITRKQLAESGLAPLFPPERAICRDEIEAFSGAGDRAFIARLRQLFAIAFPFDPLTDDQLRTIKGVMRPEIVVRRRSATPASLPADQLLLPGSVALDVLDAQQEQAARSLSTGHHVVFGIAGSGKTVLLLARARMLVDRDPTARVLVLCFNKALAAALDAQLDDGTRRRIEVRHVDSWLVAKTRLRKQDEETWEAFRGRMVDAILRAPELWPQSDRYDAVLIDEAHDFEPDWFRCAVAFLRGGAEGELLIVLDGAQSLYQRTRAFTWAGVGVQARGRTRRLDRNYRNTKQILEFAWQVAQSTLADEEETETHVRVLPRKASRQGPVPGYRSCATVAEEQAWVVGQVARFRARGSPTETSPCSTRATSGIEPGNRGVPIGCTRPCRPSARCAGWRPSRT